MASYTALHTSPSLGTNDKMGEPVALKIPSFLKQKVYTVVDTYLRNGSDAARCGITQVRQASFLSECGGELWLTSGSDKVAAPSVILTGCGKPP